MNSKYKCFKNASKIIFKYNHLDKVTFYFGEKLFLQYAILGILKRDIAFPLYVKERNSEII